MSVIDFSIKSNDMFIRQLNTIDSPFTLTQKEKELLYKRLKDTNFVLNSKNHNLIYYNEQFLISSLLNNYNQTIKILHKIDSSKVITNFENLDILSEILIHNDFVCDSSSPELFLEAPYAFIASLHIDPIKTLANYKYTASFSDIEKNYIYEKGLKEHDIPVGFLNQPFIQDRYILEKYISNKDEVDFILHNLLNPYISYSQEDEVKLLSFLNSSNATIEKEIKSMHDKNLSRCDMSIIQILAFAFYARKYLSQNETRNYRINMFNYCSEEIVKGLHTNDDIFVFVEHEPNLSTVKNILLSLTHELIHAIQQNHFIKVDLERDGDVDLYTKDFFFNTVLGKEYTMSNYQFLSFEKDANIKSSIITSIILKENIFLQDNSITIEDILKELEKMELVDKDTRKYKNKEYTIDQLMDIAIKKFKESEKRINHVLAGIFTTIAYEYDIDSNKVRKRTIKELIQGLDDSLNEKEKEIYTKLISRCISPSCKNSTQNLEILLNSQKENYSSETKIILSKIAYDHYNNQTSSKLKYIKFILDNIKINSHK